MRRRSRECSDIEIVAIPKIEPVELPVEGDLFGAKKHVQHNFLWAQLDGVLKGHYVRAGEKYRAFPWPFDQSSSIQVDLFTASVDNFGWIYLVRTGSADFSHRVARQLNKRGYTSHEGQIYRSEVVETSGKWERIHVGLPIPTPTEDDVFRLAGMAYWEPEKRI